MSGEFQTLTRQFGGIAFESCPERVPVAELCSRLEWDAKTAANSGASRENLGRTLSKRDGFSRQLAP